jgi:integrase
MRDDSNFRCCFTYTLHRFRRTSASMHAKKFSIQTVKLLLGHRDLRTTMRYLAAEQMDTSEAKRLSPKSSLGSLSTKVSLGQNSGKVALF